MLKVNEIDVFYGAIHALHGISFEVKQGNRLPDRRQRRQQIHHPERHFQPPAHHLRRHRVHGSVHPQGARL